MTWRAQRKRFAAAMRRRLAGVVVPLLLVAIGGYFVFDAIQGDNGLISYMVLNKKMDRLTIELAELERTRRALAHRVALLQEGNPDPDLLEERARAVLNYGRDDDLVILRPPGETRPPGGRPGPE